MRPARRDAELHHRAGATRRMRTSTRTVPALGNSSGSHLLARSLSDQIVGADKLTRAIPAKSREITIHALPGGSGQQRMLGIRP